MKKMKRWLALLAAVTVLAGVLLTGCGGQNTPEPTPENPDDAVPLMLWEVTDEDSNKLYLMGSIHVGTEEMVPLADPIEDAFASSDALAVECDVVAFNEDFDMQTEIAMKYGIYLDGTTVRDHLSEDVYNRAKQLLQEREMYADAYDYMKVHQWSSLVQSVAIADAGLSADYGVDMYLLNKAREVNKPIYEVESVEAQMQMMDGFSSALQEWMLELNLDVALLAEELKLTMDAWKKGDVEFLSATEVEEESGEPLTQEQEALLAEYNQEMLTDRNKLMADKAEEYIESGEVIFFTVGAGHMGGEDGVAALMEDKGYTVKRIDENGNYMGEETILSEAA